MTRFWPKEQIFRIWLRFGSDLDQFRRWKDGFFVFLTCFNILGFQYFALLPLVKLCISLLSPVTPFKGPRNLQTSEPSRTSFRVTWDHAPGNVKGYKVLFHPVGDSINLGELLVGPYDNTVVLEELRFVCGMIL